MAAKQQPGYELYKFTEKVVLYDIVIIHSLQGVLSVNTDSILDHFSESVGQIKLITCQSHLGKEQSVDQLEKLTSIYKNPKIEDSDDKDGLFDLYILDNLESIHLIDARKQLSKLIHQVSNTNGNKLWILASSENLYLLNDFTDRYPEILSQTFEIEEESQIPFVEQVQPTTEDYKNLPRKEKKFLWAVVAKNKSVLLEKRTQKQLLRLYPKHFVYPNHIQITEEGSIEDSFFSLVPSEASRYIEKKSQKPWNRFRTNKDLKWFVLFFLLIMIGFSILWYNGQNDLKKEIQNEVKRINLSNKLLINSKPGEVFNTILEQQKDEIDNQKDRSMSQKLFRWMDRGLTTLFSKDNQGNNTSLNKDYLVQAYNRYPAAPSIRESRWSGLINNSISNFDQTKNYHLVLKNDSLFIFKKRVDSLIHVLPSIQKFNSNIRHDELIIQRTDQSLYKVHVANRIEELQIYPKDTKKYPGDSITYDVIDFTMDDKGDNYAFILADNTLYYSGTNYSTKKMNLIKADIHNARVYLLWDNFIGISNNSEFKLYQIKDPSDVGNDNLNKGFVENLDHDLHLKYFQSTQKNNQNFPNGRFNIDKSSDASLVALTSYNSTNYKSKNAYLIKLCTNPLENQNISTQSMIKFNKDSTQTDTTITNYIKPNSVIINNKSSLSHKVDFKNKRIYVGQNNEIINVYTFDLNPLDSIAKQSINPPDNTHYVPIVIKDTLKYEGHVAAISQMEVFEEYKLLASLSRDNELILWDAMGIRINNYFFPPNTALKMKRSYGDNPKLYILNEGKLYEIPVNPISESKIDVNINQYLSTTDTLHIRPYSENDTLGVKIIENQTKNIFFRSGSENCFDNTLLLSRNDKTLELVFSVSCPGVNKKQSRHRDNVYKISFDTTKYTLRSEKDSALIFRMNTDAPLDRKNIKIRDLEKRGISMDTVFKHQVSLVDTFSSFDPSHLGFFCRKMDSIVIRKENGSSIYDTISLKTHFSAEQIENTDAALIDIHPAQNSEKKYFVAIAQKDKVKIILTDPLDANPLVILNQSFHKKIKHLDLIQTGDNFRIKVHFGSKDKNKWIETSLPLAFDVEELNKNLLKKYK
jgi:hypothetical protein